MSILAGDSCLCRPPQLIARDIYQSFRMGPRRIELLRGISMDIAHNEAVFLSGASGAGKTRCFTHCRDWTVLSQEAWNSKVADYIPAAPPPRRVCGTKKWAL